MRATPFLNSTKRHASLAWCWSLPWLLLMAVAQLQAAQPRYQLRVVTDRENALYQTGEEARFVVTVTQDGQPLPGGAVSYVVDDFITEYPSAAADFPRGELSLDDESRAVVAVSSDKPIFLRCQVSYQPPQGPLLRSVAGVGFSPLEIEPSLPTPDDFDAFWSDQKRQLATLPMNPTLTPVDHADEQIECFDAQIQCTGGAPVSGYLALPKNAEPKSLPAILWVHGAGVRGSSLGNAVKGAQAGMLSMDINAHGIPNGRPNQFYQQLAAGRLRDYRNAGCSSRETIYFRGMFLRLARAIDYLTSRAEWDGQAMVVLGHSQGGGQALAAGGLDDRVTLIATGVPAICDHSARAVGRVNGWPKLVPTAADGRPDATILQASRYVDSVNFAGRCRADAIMSVGFIDSVCPPSSCYAAYNRLQGDKQVINEPLMGHAAPAHIHEAFFRRVLEHVEQTRAAKVAGALRVP